ncbi:MAG: ammonia channel protein [Nitrospirae bacterium GWC2_46_6]|nr:MAG: ammonia channel protein [Nitrospirae bacterium GWA2_46_11]OGW20695.1 MAG: ammonia channel protein [Nitrospirae bacterium GWC2_46_6]OGW22741.1 MAG: ammonia channel protein [Nitrospirae bacterium GWB2_47_37]HAK89752.1 ammonia channel protein [Nitrospiraceae bacterium]HCZ11280.1 ammonia channel protein [Nitrospiraceae bacterium]
MKKSLFWVFGLMFVLFAPFSAYAETPAKIDAGDTAFILLSTALVMLMTPGLALFYGGMVRRKNVLGTIMQSFVAIAVVSIQWILFGYSLSFGPDMGGIIGSLDWIGLNGVGAEPNPDYAATIPHVAFMIYQAMFAVITPALISGAFAERMKFSAFLVFTVVWSTIVYDPVAHWVWGTGGWLKNMGVLDFAGGIVVHITSGISALAAALIIGKRKGYLHEAIYPHSLPMTVLGAGLLWFGWFGFNAGSALSSGALSATTFVATHISAVAATLIWVIIEWIHRGKPTMFGAATGSIAGLATITPASGFVGPMPALLIGLAAGAVCYIALNMKNRLGYDDSLDAFGVHGVGGILGTLAAGLFAQKLINPSGADGLFFGNPKLFMTQAIAIAVTAVYSFVVTVVVLKLIDKTIGLRIDDESEVVGLDISQHGESGYTM